MLTGNDGKIPTRTKQQKGNDIECKNTDSDKRQKRKNVELIYQNVKVKNADGKKMLMYKTLKSKNFNRK